MNLKKITSLQFVFFLSFSLLYTSFGVLQYVGISQSIPFETVNNYLGKTVIYYNQEIVSSQKTSFTVDSMMKCRTIAFVSAQSNWNVVNVGKIGNGSIICNLAYQDPTFPQVQLGPRLGMFTFLKWDYGDFSPASNGIFYKTFGTVQPAEAQNGCPGNWTVAYAITQNQQDTLFLYMITNNLNYVQINAQCYPTFQSANPTWNNSSAPFIQPVTDLSGRFGTYVTYGLENRFFCVTKNDFAHYLVCMLNMHSSLPWEEI